MAVTQRRTGRRGCVLTVGNYDGVHLGPPKDDRRAEAKRAAELRSTATVLVFEPSSKEFIDPKARRRA
jgi:riboflavin kinase/FMN adenylyltransferase